MFHVVLVEPQIPQNTGNIVRLCAATNSKLILVGHLGFKLGDKYLKRAGLDYWEFADVIHIKSFDDFEKMYDEEKENFLFFSTKGEKSYYEGSYHENYFLIFGSETKGLHPSIIKKNQSKLFRIPMRSGIRSLNLATSVGIVVYEGIRQLGMGL